MRCICPALVSVACLVFACLVPVSPACAETARVAASPPPAEDYGRLLDTLHAAFGFRHLGLLRSGGEKDLLVRAAGESARRRGYAVTVHAAPFSPAGPEACREAVDALFFEGIDALGLDDSACFDPGGGSLADLLEGLRLQGVMALSLHGETSEEQVKAGALAGPAGVTGNAARAAVAPDSASPAADRSAGTAPDVPRITVFAPLAVNPETAEAMGIALSPAALLAAEYVRGRTDPVLHSHPAGDAPPARQTEVKAYEHVSP